MHGFRLAEPQLGENVAIIGVGLLGLLAGQIAAAAGCRVLGIDTDPQRVALAESLGLAACQRDQAVDRCQAFTAGRGFDVVLICADTSSNDPVELAAVIARDRARIVATGAVGLTIPRKIYYEKELSFINSRSYGPGRYDTGYEEQGRDYPLGYVRWTEGRNFEAVAALMAEGRLKIQPLISHRFPIDKAPEAYEVITGKKKQPFLGVLLTYPEEPTTGSRVVRYQKTVFKPQDQLRLGVLGAGLYASSTLLPAIRKNPAIKLVGVASAGGLHASDAARKFGFAYATSNDDQILEDADINIVAILTRHDLHTPLAISALQAGKHVFVEKPLAISRDQLDELIQQVSGKSTSMLTVGFNRRFSPLGKKLQAFFENRSEPLSMHYRVNAGYIPATHWVHDPLQGGGRIIGEACHFIDFLSFLAGGAPVSVHARALPDNGKYCQDNVSMSFAFADGSIGVVDYLANGDKSFQKERLEVFCGGRIAVLDDFRSLELVRDGQRRTVTRPQDKGWSGEWAALAKSIREGGEPPIPYAQLIGVTKATFSVLEALRTGEVTGI